MVASLCHCTCIANCRTSAPADIALFTGDPRPAKRAVFPSPIALMPLFHDLFGVAGAAGTDVALGLPNGCKTAEVAIGPRGWLITGELGDAMA